MRNTKSRGKMSYLLHLSATIPRNRMKKVIYRKYLEEGAKRSKFLPLSLVPFLQGLFFIEQRLDIAVPDDRDVLPTSSGCGDDDDVFLFAVRNTAAGLGKGVRARLTPQLSTKSCSRVVPASWLAYISSLRSTANSCSNREAR